MRAEIISILPVYNGERFLLQTLECIAAQTRRPDKLIVLDNCSTDRTPDIVKAFEGFPCEYVRNEQNLGLFGNCNKGLGYASQTKYLHFICADDLVAPSFFERLTAELDDCPGLGLAWCADERIDENNKRLSMSGNIDGRAHVIARDAFIATKAEIGNQAFSASILKTNYQPSPVAFRLDMPILADVAFWGTWGKNCSKIVRVDLPLAQYRWHGDNTTNKVMPGIQALVLDEWRVMQLTEALRESPPGFLRQFKLRGLFAVRTGIKAKRMRQLGDEDYSRRIAQQGRRISGFPAWQMGQAVVHARDLLVYGILRRPRHPKNVYS